jgi:mannose-6-phosphate isomerase-like protein (cupin superfamily)
MEIKNIYSELKNAAFDKNAGIKVLKLVGDKDISIYIAEISPNTALNPHYHIKGIECYQILEGMGTMKTGNTGSESTSWVEKTEVCAGDCFSINENTPHQIENHTNELLKVIFICPESHMSNDRFFI